ncbi:ABC-2 type transport system permease protein [Ruminococcus sp. YE71]|nr:ABC transporter permease [Ruminococcus sp. YE78]SDA26506.1 ABC-2 type transport system permease protein [Ruminococcus sp. YE78]SFW44149.1 ABC-2 type transport system permease protein [Ruminococcus sp. YE71]
MIFYLMKNNLKLIFRNKFAVAVLLLGPALTIAMLSNAFESLMKSYTVPDEFTVGYRAQGGVLADSMDDIKEAGREAGIVFREYPDGEPEELIANNDLAAFADIEGEGYTLYTSEDHKPEGAVTDCFFDRVVSGGVDAALGSIAPDAVMSSAVPTSNLDYMPAVNSTDYYGMIYIVYFSSLGMVCATGMLSSEKKNGIERKYRVCPVSKFGLYLARLLPTAALVTVCSLIETLVTTALFGIHWGTPLLSALIVVMVILAGTAFGFMLYSLSRNMAMTIIALFAVIWVMGFLGGSFETYMYSAVSETLKKISFFYYANRSLVELSSMGKSDYTAVSLLFSGGIFAVSSAVSIAVDTIRKKV